MGWKNVKEHYHIGHFVQVTDKGICIGSGYVHDLIVISRDGEIVKQSEICRGSEDLERYVKELKSDPEKLKRLIAEPDTFTASITVYTYEGGEILEKQCEVLGWPNVTHDGQMMYENTYWTDRAKAVSRAMANALSWVDAMKERVVRKREELAEAETDCDEWCKNVRKLAGI